MQVEQFNKKLWTDALTMPLNYAIGPAAIDGCGGCSCLCTCTCTCTYV